MKSKLNRFLFSAFLALTLAGVQVVADSPLHQHTTHTVDCTLCHFEHSSVLPQQAPVLPAARPASIPILTGVVQSTPAAIWPAYHQRAPPVILT